MLKAVLLLPFNVLVTIPLIILYFNGFDIIKPQLSFEYCLMWLMLCCGAILVVWTIKLFAAVGKGSIAPWNPINKLIIIGPYAYVRNPMLMGVFLLLGAEAIFFQSSALLVYWVIFVAINNVYFPLTEEKNLTKRFGKEYQEYKHNVPRFFPRFTPWKKESKD